MLIIGCDYHPSFQQIAFVDRETGECGERKLTHKEEAESFYRDLNGRSVRVGMEATGHARWFERLLAKLNFELRIVDPAEIRAAPQGGTAGGFRRRRSRGLGHSPPSTCTVFTDFPSRALWSCWQSNRLERGSGLRRDAGRGKIDEVRILNPFR